MRIITPRTLNEFSKKHAGAKIALDEWQNKVRKANWQTYADIKKDFNSVDYIGDQRYVFNIKGNDYRVVVIVKFTPRTIHIRFVGTHSEYDRIDCKTI